MAWAALEHRWQEARSGDGQKKEQDTRRESDKKTDFNATGEREGRMKDESESDLQTAIDF